MHRRAAERDRTAADINCQPPRANHGIRPPAALTFGATQLGTDARGELFHPEGFRHVVVRASVEQGYLLRLSVASGQHKKWHTRPLAQLAAHGEPGRVGESQIQNHNVGAARGSERESLRASRRLDRVGRQASQRPTDGAPDLWLVVDNEDNRGIGHAPIRHQNGRVPPTRRRPRGLCEIFVAIAPTFVPT